MADRLDRPAQGVSGTLLAEAAAGERCNFHGSRPAIRAYAGTPLCHQCVTRVTVGDDEGGSGT